MIKVNGNYKYTYLYICQQKLNSIIFFILNPFLSLPS